MKFVPREILVRSSFGPIRAIISAEAIEALWTRDCGPNLGQNIVDVHRGILERIVFEKFAAKDGKDRSLIQVLALDVDS